MKLKTIKKKLMKDQAPHWVRVNFNVAVEDRGLTEDDFRIKQAIPTLRLLIQKAKIILLTHFDPRGIITAKEREKR